MMVTPARLDRLKILRRAGKADTRPHLEPDERLAADLRALMALLGGVKTRLALGIVDSSAMEEAARRLDAVLGRSGHRPTRRLGGSRHAR